MHQFIFTMKRVYSEAIQKMNSLDLQSFYVFYADTRIVFFFNYTNCNFILANVGGLLSLFMGFSVVSIIEILYFMTIRPYCALRKGNTSSTPINVIQKPSKSWNSEIGIEVNRSTFAKLNSVTERYGYLE